MAVRCPLIDVRQLHRLRKANRIALSVELASLGLIIATAAYTRLSHLNLVMFQDDEAAVSELAIRLVEGQGFPLIGIPSSIGVNNPPMFIYLMAIPYAFTRDPELATGFIGLLGVFAVVGCYLFTRAHFGATAAVIASLLFATHPWAVIYSRKIWSSDAMPVFAILFAASLLAYLGKGQAWRLVLTFLWLAVAIEVHFSGIVLLLMLLAACVANRDRFYRHHLLAGAIVAVATLVPYLLWQVQYHWTDLWTAADFAGRPARWDVAAAWNVFTMIASPGYVARDGSATFDLAYRIEGGLFVGGLIYVLYLLVTRHRTESPNQRRALGMLFLWVLAAVLAFTRHSMDVNRHYFVVVFPAQFIIIGVLIAGISRAMYNPVAAVVSAPLARKVSAIGAGLVSTLLMSLAVTHLYDYTAYYNPQWLGQNPQHRMIADIYNNGPPVEFTRNLYREMASLNSAHPDQPINLQVSELQKLTAMRFLSNSAVITKWLGSGAGSVLVVPPSGITDALFVTANVDGQAARLLRSLDPAPRILTMTYPASDVRVAFYRIGADTRFRALRALDLKPLPYTLDNGVRLLGYGLPRLAPRGGAVGLVVAWEVGKGSETSRMGYQFFAHLVDAKARPWGKVDALDYGSSQWSQGDTVICRYQIPIDPNAPPGIYHVLIGMYDHEGTRPIPVVGPNGQLAENVVSLGPLKVAAGPGPLTSRDAIVKHRQVAQLGDKVTFLGYDLPESVIRPGDVLSLTVHWMAGAPRPDYTVFVHLVDQSGRLVAQVDSQPRMGEYPTSTWDEGEYVRDEYRLELPRNLPAGTYGLVTGLYQLETGQRLLVTNEDGQPAGDSIELDSTINVP